MRRREFIALTGSALVALSRTVRGEQAPKVARIGYLYPGSQAAIAGRTEAMLNGLRDLGYIEGRNLVVERRYGEWKLERLRDLADELVALKVDVIVAAATPAARAAKQATSTIPIVAVSMGDPVGDDLVASLGSPGGNLTGNTFLGPELVAKRLQLFRDAVPGFSRLAALWHPGAYGEATIASILKETETASARSGVQLQLVGGRWSPRVRRCILCGHRRASRCSNRAAKPDVICRAQAHCGAGGEKPVARNVSGEGVCRGWRPHVLRIEFSRPSPTRGRVY